MKNKEWSVFGRSGFTIIEILIWVIIIAVIVAIFAILLIQCGSQMTAAVRPSLVTVTGPVNIVAGQSATFTVRVEFNGVYNNQADSNISVIVYEDDFVGDIILDQTIIVKIPRGRTFGEQTFVLDCNTSGRLGGVSGRDSEFNPYQVYAEVQPQQGALVSRTSANLAVNCVEPPTGQ